MRNGWWAPILLSCLITLTSCSSPAPYVPPAVIYSYPQVVTVDTAGVSIEALDGSFSLTQGEVYQTPFRSASCPTEPTTLSVDEVLRGGGKRVSVDHPGYDGTLYGVLAFCPLPTTLSGTATRSYLVQAPQQYVDATTANRVSVVYEPVGDAQTMCSNTCSYANDGECDDGGVGSQYSACSIGTDCNDCGARGDRRASWILFLSRIPL
jgi:hypothetical protein